MKKKIGLPLVQTLGKNDNQVVMETSDFIIDNLYLGPISAAKNEKDLNSKNITHILSLLQKPLREGVRLRRTCMNVTAIDTPSCDIMKVFPECFRFIDQARDGNTGVLVHCQAGCSRSASVVIAYLMYKYNLSYQRAIDKVKACRPIICPNKGFEEQLQKFEFLRHRLKVKPFQSKVKPEIAESCAGPPTSPCGEPSNSEEIVAKRLMDNTPDDVYKCRKCRTKLFNKSDVMPHYEGEGEAAFGWRGRIPGNQRPDRPDSSLLECGLSLFVNTLPWMGGCDAESGKLHCPKCGTKIGSYVWHGEKCPCGMWVTPAFHIDTGKVDNLPCDLAQGNSVVDGGQSGATAAAGVDRQNSHSGEVSHQGSSTTITTMEDMNECDDELNAGNLNCDSDREKHIKDSPSSGSTADCHQQPVTDTSSQPVKTFRILEQRGDLFSCHKSVSLAHCVSEDLQMSRGIAAQFKKRFKGVEELRRQEKSTGDVAVLLQHGGSSSNSSSRFVYYLVTKDRYFQKPTYRSLESSLEAMRRHAVEHGVTRLAMPRVGCGLDRLDSMPRVGCGLDRLDWERVKRLITSVFETTEISVTVYSL